MPRDVYGQQQRLLNGWNLNQEGRGHYGSLADYFGLVVCSSDHLGGKSFQSRREVARKTPEKGSDMSEPFFFMLGDHFVFIRLL